MYYSVSELSRLQLLTSGSYGLSVLGVGDIVVIFWKKIREIFREDFHLFCFILF